MRELLLYAQIDQLNEATAQYISTIAKAAEGLGFQLRHTRYLREVPNGANVLTVECKSAFKLLIARPQAQVWLWMQGIYPEEARLQFNSRGREYLQNVFEATTLRHARGVVMVSEAMRRHLARKYPRRTLNTFVMPCANASIQPQAFYTDSKYSQPNFVYAGSLHAWQCFDLTLDVFREFQSIYPHARLTILTGSQVAARRAVATAGLQGVDVDFVPLEKLQERLAGFKYGFVLRNAHVVNEVATPTKVSSYMAAGVIPVMTNAVHDYRERLANTNPMVMVDAGTTARAIAESIAQLEAQTIKAATVLDSYQRVFDSYFEHERYVPVLRDFLARTGMHAN